MEGFPAGWLVGLMRKLYDDGDDDDDDNDDDNDGGGW